MLMWVEWGEGRFRDGGLTRDWRTARGRYSFAGSVDKTRFVGGCWSCCWSSVCSSLRNRNRWAGAGSSEEEAGGTETRSPHTS